MQDILLSTNAEESLKSKLASKASIISQLAELTTLLETDKELKDIACFDVSHHMGDKSVAACVRLNEDGFSKNDYRRFNIEGITPGDDYAAISNAVENNFFISSGILDISVRLPSKYLRSFIITSSHKFNSFNFLTKCGFTIVNSPERLDFT